LQPANIATDYGWQLCFELLPIPKGARMTATIILSPRDLPLLPDGAPYKLPRCSISLGHRAACGIKLPQATWDGAKLRTLRGYPHHQVHAPPATHGVPPVEAPGSESDTHTQRYQCWSNLQQLRFSDSFFLTRLYIGHRKADSATILGPPRKFFALLLWQ
jgi:hypothetical protein